MFKQEGGHEYCSTNEPGDVVLSEGRTSGQMLWVHLKHPEERNPLRQPLLSLLRARAAQGRVPLAGWGFFVEQWHFLWSEVWATPHCKCTKSPWCISMKNEWQYLIDISIMPLLNSACICFHLFYVFACMYVMYTHHMCVIGAIFFFFLFFGVFS